MTPPRKPSGAAARSASSTPTRRTVLTGLVGGAVMVGLGVSGCTSAPERTVSSSDEAVNRSSRSVSPVFVGYVPYWDQPRAFATVRRFPAAFDQISPVWYSLDGNGAVVPSDDSATKIDAAAVAALQRQGKKVVPTLTSMRNGDWAPDLVRTMLADDGSIDRHVAAIDAVVARAGYDGIDIDYEDLKADDRDAYTRFLTELGGRLHDRGKILTSSVYAKDSEPGPNDHNQAQDYAAIGEACDQVRVMTFDYHYTDSEPGPTAPLDWVDRMISWAVTQVPANKVMLGVVLSGYDWPAGGSADDVTWSQASAIASQNGATVQRGQPGDSPNFRYTKDGVDREVWYEDARSSSQKLDLVAKHGLGGATFWRLGGEDPATWSTPQVAGHRAPGS